CAGGACAAPSRRGRGRSSPSTCWAGGLPRPTGRTAGSAGPTSGCPPTARRPPPHCARPGSAPPRSGWRSPATAARAAPGPRWPASPCSTGCRPARRWATSASTTTRTPSRRPGSAGSSPASRGSPARCPERPAAGRPAAAPAAGPLNGEVRRGACAPAAPVPWTTGSAPGPRAGGGREKGGDPVTDDETALLDGERLLQAEAEEVAADLRLDERLSSLGDPVRVGAAALGVLVRRDLDVTVACPRLDAAAHRAVADLGARLSRHPRV